MESDKTIKKDKSVIFETVPLEDLKEESVKGVEPQEIKDKDPEIEVAPENFTPKTVNQNSSPLPYEVSNNANGFNLTNFNLPGFNISGNKKYLIIGIFVIFTLLIFYFLLNLFTGAGSEKKDITLTYWGLWEDKEILDPLIADYQTKNPGIKINYVKMDRADYREKLIQRSKSGQGPDIFRFHNTWVKMLKEIMTPVPSSIYSNSEYENTFYPVTKEDLKIDSNYYGIPLEIDGLVLVYNNDLFKKAGILVPPTTWQELIDDAVKLTVKGTDGKVINSGIALGLSSNIEHFSDIFGWMLLQNGLDLTKISSDMGVDTLESFVFFRGDDKESSKRVWDEFMPNSSVAFIEGKVAMVIVPSWHIANLKEANPNLEIKVTTLPTTPGGLQVCLANYWVEGVSRFSKNQLEAWKFVKFLSEKENMVKLYAEQAKVRPFGEPYSRIDLANTLIQDPYVGSVIQQAKYMKSLPLISRTFDNGINDEIIKYIENAINSRLNATTSSEALKKAQEGINQVLSKYGN